MPTNILRAIADSPELLVAVRSVFEKQFAVDLNTQMPNELLGQVMRARLDGLNAIGRAMKEIESYKSEAGKEEVINPAR